MKSQFRIREDITPFAPRQGMVCQWVSSPAATGAGQIVAMNVTIAAGHGHGVHAHPGQEELLCVVDGEVEQWIGTEKRLLGPGDAIFIAPGAVHATFNPGQTDARLVVVFSPCIGDGFETIELAGEAQWRGVRD